MVLSIKPYDHNGFLGGRKTLFLLLTVNATFGLCRCFLSSPYLSSMNNPNYPRILKQQQKCSVTRPNIPDAFSVIDDDEDDSDVNTKEHPYKPSVFQGTSDDDENENNGRKVTKRSTPRSSFRKKPLVVKNKNNVDNDRQDNNIKTIGRPKRMKNKKISVPSGTMAGTSWMEKNAKFNSEDANSSIGLEDNETQSSSNKFKREIPDTKTFRQDFRNTRVFVQNIPQGVSWQDLKDHFKQAGNVVFASVSVDVNTGESKGHGIVQYETIKMAQNSIQIMRNYPLNGISLYVREDVQENNNPNARLRTSSFSQPNKSLTPPTIWKCGNEDNTEYISEDELTTIKNLIKARDDARKRRKYDVSDRLRDELKTMHGVFIDDRLKMWWTSVDGNKVPKSISDIKGDGRWNIKPWRQIPTTPENDMDINPDMVEGLLRQRDIARREKDFPTADRLLEEARTSPDGDLTVRIHDESRTWRAWTENRPPVGQPYEERRPRAMPSDPVEARKTAAKECVEIVTEHAPEKLEEIVEVLKKFPGREFQALKRLRQQYL
mmetsp:Transcript_41393/g.46220  ORF Transcript_41393/g.46220 Transcript_41393/m.46220 type:complete len:547 (+) Transcript_41393:203-1843(+)|eukprot:CAMPEP_0170988180 /NCGR_PEP_ID=MMETSP0736-20130129/7021_1 /TAXON_ID=186038 /ORGANISM="Fragilariopsis kerguelensis, Strain L26-C5" /LENGTH=546 /DNA_ID=CAMNT_0011412451 /DNA_START=197 /DNA_END=1837 /DNA_ORIENTATION=+